MTTAESLSQSMALVGDQGTPCGRRWSKQWVPQETVLNPGKCMLLKWVTDDMLKSLRDEQPPVEEEPEEEYEVLYLCTYEGCGRSFTDQGALRKHTNIHGEKQFVCHYEGCGKRFMDSSKLKRHFLIHTGERPFVCPVDGCGKAFSLDFNLRSHMRTHTQENYHICPFEECGKRYAHEYKLRAHLRTCHEKVLPPEMKLAPPPLPPSLEKEIRIQKSAASAAAAVASASGNLERPFACHHPGCDKRYKHEYKLNLHLRKEHANEPQPRGKAVILQNRGVRKQLQQQQHRDRMIREAEDDGMNDGMDDEGSEKEVVIRALANSRKAKTGRAVKTAAAAVVAKTAKRPRPRQRQRPKASVAATGPRLVLQPPKVRPGGRRKEVMVVVNEPAHADSEETEEEEEEEDDDDGGGGGVDDDNDNDDDDDDDDGDDTEDDDIGRLMHVRKKPYDDDEETEDDDDME